MKINVITTGRFHLLDLARELSTHGHDVKLYSYVSRKRCVSFGMKSGDVCSYLWFAAPFLFLCKLFPKSESLQKLKIFAIDYFMGHYMRDADVCIGLGSIFNYTLRCAKKRGQTYILEWGSMHILDQLRIFNVQHPQWTIDRELWEYEHADYISIAANHVKDTFVSQGISESKLFVNPYGVNLSDFYPTVYTGEYDIIAVGGWRYEKGSDLIVEMLRDHPELRFLHVGALAGMEFPDLPNMTHVNPVDQRELVKYYAKAKVFILPSRGEGLALVQAQALACGLPVVCSRFTGGSTLMNLVSNKHSIKEMSTLDYKELYSCITQTLLCLDINSRPRQIVGNEISDFSWSAYGLRYHEFLLNIGKN